jgi:hypothetical protein
MVPLDAPALLIAARASVWLVEAAIADCVGYSIVGSVFLWMIFLTPFNDPLQQSLPRRLTASLAIILPDRIVLSTVFPDIGLGAFLAFAQMVVIHTPMAVELIQRLLYFALEANLASHGVSPLEWSIAPLPLDAQG